MIVVWSKPARQDLEKLHDYIAEENEAAAKRVVETLIHATDQLELYPDSGAPGRVFGTRELLIPKYRYRLPYYVSGDEIIILRVMHMSRKWF